MVYSASSRWYYASVTYADYMLGKAITKLQELGLENNTIIVFHADHGCKKKKRKEKKKEKKKRGRREQRQKEEERGRA